MECLTSVVELGLGSTDPYPNLYHSSLHISLEYISAVLTGFSY